MIKKIINIDEEKKISILDNERNDLQPMIFIHGLTGNQLQLQHYSDYYIHNYRIISFDLRGRGDSGYADKPSSLVEHAKDILTFLQLYNINEPIIVGYSMGAYIASIIAGKIKVSGLILLDGAASMSEHQDKIVSPTFSRLAQRFDSKEKYIDTVVERYLKMGIEDSIELRKILAYEINQKEDGWYNKADEISAREDWNSFYDYDVGKICNSIKAPTLLIKATGKIGDFPPLFLNEHYEKTEQSIKDLVVEVTDASHYTLVFEKRLDVLQIMDKFLLSIKKRRSYE